MGSRMKRILENTDEALSLTEPRENAFLKLHTEPKKLFTDIEHSLSRFGSVSGSTTFPLNCVVELIGSASTFIENELLLRTFDVNNKSRTSGGDPVQISISKVNNSLSLGLNESIGVTVKDNDDGTYRVLFRANEAAEYWVLVTIFGRQVKNSPFSITVDSHHSPVWQFGCEGSGDLELRQPVKICQNSKGHLYILDTGNDRIKVLTERGDFAKHISCSALTGGSTVGLALLSSGDVITLNWKTKEVCKSNGSSGDLLQTMSFSEFIEPIDICIDNRGRFLIADMSLSKVFVLDPGFRPLFNFNVSAYSHGAASITCLAVGLNDDILVGTCSSLLLFDGGGRFLHDIPMTSSNERGRMMATACAVCPSSGLVVAAVVDSKRNRSHLAICQYKGTFLFAIDCYGSRLKHPCGVCIGSGLWQNHCFVVDSATHSVKAVRYR
ncbi:hypothetical protein AB6A40_006873 [Gnathostoma spinigerum]|uniref:Uncharacterized protein n=1 Tax=Gnathostoma spinigerum TaxID=75299 RepID=A0ABD6ES92_9BILA